MLRFDRAGVDIAGRVVELDGVVQHLEPQAFDLLAYLLTNRDRVVPKAELLDEVWGDQFVSESSLTTRVKEVRRALGDDGVRQAVVKNFRGRGYRFMCEVTDEPAAPTSHPATAPVISPLQGRVDEIAEVAGLLDQAAVVTLTGPGGVGKTSLALEVARHVGHRYPDGVAVARLAPVTEPSGLLHVLRHVTGLSDADGGEHQLLAAIADLSILVVIDNCEHLIDESARVVDAIAANSGPARVLATSRERLGVRSEQVRPVHPLDPAAASDLLVERVRSLQPGWSADPASIERLVALVDRLPLAIEMAAARLPTVAIDELLQLLEGRLDLLQAPLRTTEDRHSTLPALIEWSENLLAPDARQLLADLSVFAGPVAAVDVAPVVDADAAELVAGPLAGLVEQSLVVADTSHQPTRYNLLETVRACVADRRDRPVVDRRHAEYVAQQVQAADRVLRGPGQAAAVDRIEQLIPELRAAHRWARQHDPAVASSIISSLLYFAHEQQWDEPADWSRQLLDQVDRDGPTAASACACLAADASNRGRFDEARTLATIAATADDPVVAASALDSLANVGLYTGDLDLAMENGKALLALADETGDPVIWTLGVLDDVLARLYSGGVDDARSRFDELSPPGDLSPTSLAWLSYAEGEMLTAQGRYDDAVVAFDRVAERAGPLGSGFVKSVATVSALASRARAGDVEAALSAFTPVLVDYRRIRNLTHGITALRNLIGLLVRAAYDEPAAVLLGTLSNPDIKSTYGAESELVDQARTELAGRNPADVVARWNEEGQAHDALWALDYAVEFLAGA
jgi:predicted ATPase